METRTANAKKNIKSSVAYQLVNIIVKFGLRSVFIHYLGEEYLGIDGAFSNILSLLSLAELGLGSAIVYDMYKPIAENDKVKIAQLVQFYKKAYSLVGSFIFVCGMVLIPFLDYIITDVPNVSNIRIIYILFLIRTSSSYFFAHYSTIISANQKNYIITKINFAFSIIKTIVEIIIIIALRNYIAYLIADIILLFTSNLLIYRKAIMLFPYINNRTKAIEKKAVNKIWCNTKNMLSIRIGNTIVNATDSLIISAMISTRLVGKYSNYALIVQIVLASSLLIENAIIAGVGNVCAEGNIEKKKNLLDKAQFIFMSIYAIISCGMIMCIQPFIKVCFGENLVLANGVVIIIIMNCYLNGIHQAVELFVYADGLFNYFSIKPWIEAVINVVLSIIMGKKFGIGGVLGATTLCLAGITFWYDSLIVYHYSLKTKYKRFLKRFCKLFTITVIYILLAFLINYKVLDIINDYYKIVIYGMVSVILFGLIWCVTLNKTKEFRYIISFLERRKSLEK